MSLPQKGFYSSTFSHNVTTLPLVSSSASLRSFLYTPKKPPLKITHLSNSLLGSTIVKTRRTLEPISAALPVPPPLDLTENNVRQVLADARAELGQIFDTSVGITGVVELAELDGPFVKISLKGRFWHKRSDVLARVANYLKQRIPEILEVDIEDEKQLDDSPENF